MYGCYTWKKEEGEWKKEDQNTSPVIRPFTDNRVYHSSIGIKEGIIVAFYKGMPTIMMECEILKYIGFKEVGVIHIIDFDIYNGIVLLVDNLIENKKVVNSITYLNNNGFEQLSICGEGMGEQNWIDDDSGYEMPCFEYEDCETVTFKNNKIVVKSPPTKWPREKDCLSISTSIIEEIVKKNKIIL